MEATETNWVEDWGAEVRRKFGEVETTLAIQHSRASWWGNLQKLYSDEGEPVIFRDMNSKLQVKVDEEYRFT